MSKKNKEIGICEPRMVKSHDVTQDVEYVEWIAWLKHRYGSVQVKAAVKVNGEKLLFGDNREKSEPPSDSEKNI